MTNHFDKKNPPPHLQAINDSLTRSKSAVNLQSVGLAPPTSHYQAAGKPSEAAKHNRLKVPKPQQHRSFTPGPPQLPQHKAVVNSKKCIGGFGAQQQYTAQRNKKASPATATKQQQHQLSSTLQSLDLPLPPEANSLVPPPSGCADSCCNTQVFISSKF